MPQGKQMVTGEGSGFFISADGYAVTNYHVVDHAQTVQVTTDDGAAYDAKVIGTDARTDLALIKVDADTSLTCSSHKTIPGSVIGLSRSAIPSDLAAQSLPALSPLVGGISDLDPMTSTSKSTRRSTRVTPVAQRST